MTKNKILAKILILVIFVISFTSTIIVGYAYFDNVENSRQETINIGEWFDLGTPIYTAQDFYDFATKTDSISTDRYYLANDIDFTGFSWVYDNTINTVTFGGTLFGNDKTISNLTIFADDTANLYMGVFPIMEGGTIQDLTLENVQLDLGTSGFSAASSRNGLLVGQVFGLTNTISNITITNSGVRGSSVNGTGGLIGEVANSSVVNIDNIVADNLKVFSTDQYVGGLIGAINSATASVTISDIDIEGDIYSDAASGYTGGVIGYITTGAGFTLDRAIVEITSQNTLETSISYLSYTNWYVGGIIGYNASDSTKVVLNDVFFTGSLLTGDTRRFYYVGTATSSQLGTLTINNSFYSMVEFFDRKGNIVFTLDKTADGDMLTVVNDASMPSVAWWNTFATTYNNANSLWDQDVNGRLFLIR